MHDDSIIGAEATATGISRRDLLRKGAVVGGAGALMWAAPSITKFGGAAFGAEGTPPTGFSYAAAIVDCVGGPAEGYRIKYEYDDRDWDDGPGTTTGGNALPACDGVIDATAWNAALPADGGDFGISIGGVDGQTLVLTLPATSPNGKNCTFRNGTSNIYGVVKEGRTGCEPGVVSNLGKTLTFDLTNF
jgi:hypothetical protein